MREEKGRKEKEKEGRKDFLTARATAARRERTERAEYSARRRPSPNRSLARATFADNPLGGARGARGNVLSTQHMARDARASGCPRRGARKGAPASPHRHRQSYTLTISFKQCISLPPSFNLTRNKRHLTTHGLSV